MIDLSLLKSVERKVTELDFTITRRSSSVSHLEGGFGTRYQVWLKPSVSLVSQMNWPERVTINP